MELVMSVDLVGFILLLLILPTTWYVWSRMTSKLPPGPTPLPVLGNYFSLTKDEIIATQLHKISDKYGKVFTIYFGPMPFVVLSNFEAVKEAFITQANTFAGRPFNLAGEIFSEGNNDVAFTNFGPTWILHRRLTMVALKKFADKNTVSHLVFESASDVCSLMLKQCETQGKVVDVKAKMFLLIYNVIAAIVFGKKFGENDSDFKTLTKNMEQVNDSLANGFVADNVPALKFLPTPAKRRMLASMAVIFDYMDANISEHKTSLDESNPRDITDHVLITRAEMERDGAEDMSMFTDVHVRAGLADMFVAGTNTSCFTLLWALLYCIQHPDEQEKVREEIERNIGTKMVAGEDKQRLTYTDAFLLEVMRVRPIVPLAVPHTTTTASANLYGYQIHKGVNVIPNIWSCHYDPAYWSEPQEFRPSRFIDAKSGKVMQKPDSFLPFSVGRRACAGEHLARVDTFIIFATLIQKLKFSTVGPTRPKQEALTPDSKLGFMFCLPQEFEIYVESR